MIRALNVSACVLILATVVARPAEAQDFSFVVPVQATKLPSNVKTVAATCEVTWRDARVTTNIGKGTSQVLPIPAGGNFMGELTVPVTAAAGKDRTKANEYHCWVHFTATDPSGAVVDYFRWDDPTLGPNPPRTFPTVAGAPLVTDLRGSITP